MYIYIYIYIYASYGRIIDESPAKISVYTPHMHCIYTVYALYIHHICTVNTPYKHCICTVYAGICMVLAEATYLTTEGQVTPLECSMRTATDWDARAFCGREIVVARPHLTTQGLVTSFSRSMHTATDWDARAFRGGETVIAKPRLLDYWATHSPSQGLEHDSLFSLVPPEFGRLTVFVSVGLVVHYMRRLHLFVGSHKSLVSAESYDLPFNCHKL